MTTRRAARQPQAVPGGVPAHGRRDADPGGAGPGRRRVRRGPGRRRGGVRRGQVRAGTARGGGTSAWIRWSRRCWRASAAAARAGSITVYALLTAMRTAARSLEIAELAVRHRDAGVVGFDIAGAEAGNRPSRHLDAFQYVERENFHITIHAGEGFGLPSIWEALQWCGADRLGHGVRIIDDIEVPDEGEGHPSLGRLAGLRPGPAGSRSRCARPRTCRPAPRRRSRTIRSGCCGRCSSGSPSTPTTG